MVCFSRYAYEMSCRFRDPYLHLARGSGLGGPVLRKGKFMIFFELETLQAGGATYRRRTFGVSLTQMASIAWLLSRFF